jgi:hypothetical protein
VIQSVRGNERRGQKRRGKEEEEIQGEIQGEMHDESREVESKNEMTQQDNCIAKERKKDSLSV